MTISNEKLNTLFNLVNNEFLNEEFESQCDAYYKLYCNRFKTEKQIDDAIAHLENLIAEFE